MKKVSPQDQARTFLELCQQYGFSCEVASDSVLRITKSFTIGDKDAFTYCDMFGGSVLSNAPLKGGSVWGTDGGSIGGQTALNSGRFTLNKSGSSAKRFMAALRKII